MAHGSYTFIILTLCVWSNRNKYRLCSMALDTRRYRERQAQQSKVHITSSSIPGLVILAIGVMVIVAGVILMASFGTPKTPFADNKETYSGPITLGVGGLLSLIGICLSVYLKNSRKKEKTKVKSTQRISPNQNVNNGGMYA